VVNLLPVPGFGGWHELLVALVLIVAWVLNASLAALCPARWRGPLAALELALMLWFEQANGWRADSALLWLWGNQLTSLLAGFGLPQALSRRLGESVRLPLRTFWRLAWPMLLLVGPANLAIAGLRLWLKEV